MHSKMNYIKMLRNSQNSNFTNPKTIIHSTIKRSYENLINFPLQECEIILNENNFNKHTTRISNID